MNKKQHLLSVSLLLIFTLACSAGAVVLTPAPQPVDAPASFTPHPTFTSIPPYISPEPSGFPFAARLNEALPKENLILARHFYGDPSEQIQNDEVCYDVGIYNDDTYIAVSCAPNFTYPASTGTLDETQAKFLQRWVEKFQSFEEPSIHGLFVFNGRGSNNMEYSDQVSMQAMLSKIEWDAHQYASGGGTPLVVFHARSVLMHDINLWLDNSSILKFEAVYFPNACLDAPKPNEVCEPVVTQGFRIYLVAQGMLYEYHTDTFGYDIRPFGEPQIAPTQGPGG